MRSVQDHLAAVLASVGPVAPLDVVLADAAGCILAADVVAPADLPALTVAERDGYAVAAQDTTDAGPTSSLTFPVAHDVLAGAAAPLRLPPRPAGRGAARGAPPPGGAAPAAPPG